MLNFKDSFIVGSFIGVPQKDGRVFLVSANTAGLGHCCGYVMVPKSHPFHGMSWDDIPCISAQEITFSDAAGEISALKKFKNHWLIGFDHAHAWDYVPGFQRPERHWNDRRWMEPHLKRLSKQMNNRRLHTIESTFKDVQSFAAALEASAKLLVK